jgi:hypothetical protein
MATIRFVHNDDPEIGSRSYPTGSAVFIPGNTLYSFRAGPEGLRFLNFRARADFTYIAK